MIIHHSLHKYNNMKLKLLLNKDNSKTKVWLVTLNNKTLARIYFLQERRKYIFEPFKNTIWNSNNLIEILDNLKPDNKRLRFVLFNCFKISIEDYKLAKKYLEKYQYSITYDEVFICEWIIDKYEMNLHINHKFHLKFLNIKKKYESRLF